MIETDLREESPPVAVSDLELDDVIESRHHTEPSPPKRRRLAANTKFVLWVVLAIGVLAVWVLSYARFFSGVEEHADQRGLYDTFREQLATATAPLGGEIKPGVPVALINAPAARINDAVVVEGTSSEVMRSGPGHRRNSALPGQVGSAVFYGRSVTFGAPFADIADLVPGDPIDVTTGQGEFEYVVEAVRRPGDPLPTPLQEGESRLILVSSESGGMLQGWAAQEPIYVDARLDGKVADTPPGRIFQVGATEEALATSTASLMPLVLWLQLLLVVTVAWVWAARRWSFWPAWIVASTVFMAALWGATGAAFGLLPNLL